MVLLTQSGLELMTSGVTRRF